MSRIDEVRDLLLKCSLASSEDFVGCSESEIERFEATLRSPIPLVYREFLSKMGRRAGPLLGDVNGLYPYILDVEDAARELLEDMEESITLEEDAIVISMYRASQFMYVRSSEGDDPPVYTFADWWPEKRGLAESFSTYLLRYAKDYARERLPGRPDLWS